MRPGGLAPVRGYGAECPSRWGARCLEEGMSMAFRIKPCLLAVVLSLAAHVAVAVPVPAAEAGARQVTERKVGAYREVLAALQAQRAAARH